MENKRFNGKRLRRIRERQKMSQFALACAIEVEMDLVNAWERGRFVPGKYSVNKLCAVLRCEEADLYERYSVIGVWPQHGGKVVILMRSKIKEKPHWCVQYGGSGHYFVSVYDAFAYCDRRGFDLTMSPAPGRACSAGKRD